MRDDVNTHHGRRPLAPKPRSEKRLSVDEREEISRGVALGESFRAIGCRLGRAASSVSREDNANGGRDGYRAVAAETAVSATARQRWRHSWSDSSATRSSFRFLVLERWTPLNVADTAALRAVPDALKRSLGWDQGKEIHGHEEPAASAGVTVYVCNPHSPWQRGSNENTNELLRHSFPRSTDFYDLDRAVIADVQMSLNDRPRCILGFRSPAAVFTTAC